MNDSTHASSTPRLSLRRASERGVAEHGWLSSRHTFSFSEYFDPRWQGFRNLLVINDDRVAPGKGFGTHGHRDMEIVSYVLEGSLEHKDSMGTGSVIVPGDVQRMSAGTGVRHSEYNASADTPVHFLQIWIEPKRAGIAPGYEQRRFTPEEKRGRLAVLASPEGEGGGITIHADATIRGGLFAAGEQATYEVPRGRHAWVHVARGKVKVGEHELAAGDAAFTSEAGPIAIAGTDEGGEVLVFDLA